MCFPGRSGRSSPRTKEHDVRDIVKKVAGISGMHTVRREKGQWMCTCRGFIFHGKCKHIKQELELIEEFGEQ